MNVSEVPKSHGNLVYVSCLVTIVVPFDFLGTVHGLARRIIERFEGTETSCCNKEARLKENEGEKTTRKLRERKKLLHELSKTWY